MNPVEDFKDRVRDALVERANKSINLMGQVRFRPPQPAGVPKSAKEQNAVALASFGIEEIALAHSIHQAEAAVLTEMIGELDKLFRKAMGESPEPNNPEKAAGLAAQSQEQKKRIY